MAYSNYKLPIIPLPKVHRVGDDRDIPTQVEYDEVIYNYNTMTYETLSQRNQIQQLRQELEEKEKQRVKNIKSIVGYFYKKR